MRRGLTCLFAGVSAIALAGCSSDPRPVHFTPSQTGGPVEGSAGVHLQPILPVPSLGGDGPNSGNGRGGSSTPGSQPGDNSKRDPRVVATNLTAPTGLTMMPDGSALVGERTTGRIVRVQPQPGLPVPTVRTLRGLDTSGDGGLLDLAISPTYDEDNLIYAYITTRTDNRVVTFSLKGPVTTVLTGIPKGSTGNTGRLMFGADHNLYIGTGDAGKANLAANSHSLAGKILRITDIGHAAPGNPGANSPIWTSGHRVVDGLCATPRTRIVLEAEAGASGHPDEVNAVRAGDSYGFPTPATGDRAALATLPRSYSSPGGCAVLNNRMWITSLDGTALVSAAIIGSGNKLRLGKLTPALKKTYGRLRTVVAADDGALWLTTSNRDGKGHPVATDERVIRYVPDARSQGGSQT